MKRQSRPLMCIIAFAIGMGGELHLYFPSLGTVAMLDIVAYICSPLVIMMQWRRMGKFMRRVIIMAFLWSVASMIANFFFFVDVKYWFKCVVLASSSWAIISVSYYILKECPRGYLWYLVGAGLGGWISLYYFRNGAIEFFATHGDFGGGGYGTEFLMDKQKYPAIARGILLGIILPFVIWFKKSPTFIICVSIFYTGTWLLFNGGSRSNFGIWCTAAAIGMLVAYGKNIYIKIAKHPVLMAFFGLVAFCLVFGGYKYLASSGKIGEEEENKYEAEFGAGGEGAIKGRARFDYAIDCALESYGIGMGAHLRCHSVMANSLACEGVCGLIFWAYFYWLVFWWMLHRLPYSGKYSSFIAIMMLTACWAVFGSPFGTRHKFFVLMALIALCRDNPFYGVGSFLDTDAVPIEGGWRRRYYV